jgi:hypothetical protein
MAGASLAGGGASRGFAFFIACFSFFIPASDARWPEWKMKNMQ